MTSPDDTLPEQDIVAPLDLGISVIEASAGTGKTWTITSLYVRMIIEEGVPVPRILALTFARAAAGELRSRIRERLREARDALVRSAADRVAPLPADRVLRSLVTARGTLLPADELARRANRANAGLEALDTAPISTIHGFCFDVRTQWAFDLDATLGPKLVEDEQSAIADAADDYLLRLSSELSGAGFRRIRGNAKLDRRSMRRLAAAVVRRPDAHVLPARCRYSAATDVFRAAHAAFVAWWRESGRAAFLDEVAAAREAETLLGKTFGRGSNGKDLSPFTTRLDALEVAIAAPTEAAMDLLAGVGLHEADFRAKLAPCKELPERGPWREVMAFLERARALREDAARGGFLWFLDQELGARRRRANELNHDDLLFDLRAALCSPKTGPAVLQALRAAHDVALIDEVQDTDQAQWDIFRTVFHEAPGKRLFLVGDPKQAIYGFRGADVRVYESARAATPRDRQRTLRENYRSDGALVHAVDVLWRDRGAVFEEPAPRYVRVRSAENVHPWTALQSASLDGSPAALQIRWFDADTFHSGSAELALSKTSATELVPTLVAADIVRLLRGGTKLRQRERPSVSVAPRDIAVLVRTNRQAAAVQVALTALGLPAVIAASGNVFHAEEAGWMSRWLTALADGTERSARAFALTPLGGHSVASLHQAVNAPDDVWAASLERLAEQRTLLLDRGFSVALQACLEARYQPLLQLARASGGERALTNLRHLEERLQAAERTVGRSPSALLAWLSARRADDAPADSETELRLESDRDAVRVATIHGSKGLEYPIVFLPFAWDGALNSGAGPTVFHERDAGGRPTSQTVIDARARHSQSPPGRDAYKLWEREETLAENLRLFYVASTRARHQLVLYVGAVATHGDAGGFATSPLGIVLFGGRDPDAAPGTRATLARTEISRRLDANDRGVFRTTVDELAALAEATRPPGGASHRGPVISWDDSPLRTPPRTSAGARVGNEIAQACLWIAPFSRGRAVAAYSPLQRASYTSLTARAPHVLAREPAATAPISERLAPVPLASFPRGPAVGVYVHALLERLDFQTARERDEPHRPASVRGGRELADFAREEGEAFGIPDAAARQLADQLPAILRAELGSAAGDIRLRDLGPHARLDELSFDLSVAGGTIRQPAALGRVVHGRALTSLIASTPLATEPPLPWPASYTQLLAEGALDVPDFAGLLTGSLDLVYRVRVDGDTHTATTGHDYRYFVADYKTNWLGVTSESGEPESTEGHYASAALVDAMVKHHYFIQAYLYLVALHRFLQSRLGDAYDYDRHVGGAVYLFLRGMGITQHPGSGVLAVRPPKNVIEALDALLTAGSEGR